MSQPSNPVNLNDLLAGREIDQEFLSRLSVKRNYYQEAADKEPTRQVTDSDLPPMPYSERNLPPDPRIKNAQGGSQSMAVMLMEILYRPLTGKARLFLVSRDTVAMLFAESQDLKKFPAHLMNDPNKLNERSIRFNEVLGNPVPNGSWLGEIPDGPMWDTLAFYWYSLVKAR